MHTKQTKLSTNHYRTQSMVTLFFQLINDKLRCSSLRCGNAEPLPINASVRGIRRVLAVLVLSPVAVSRLALDASYCSFASSFRKSQECQQLHITNQIRLLPRLLVSFFIAPAVFQLLDSSG
ncbi:hypothetical protein N7G274_004078 [Stereocaulon virgatum]|uniref:Uncharacterized protein n=1 Tax=Stereocaulon virgatum TaxID=373712 RepID=A0ABR4AAW4_9LECA